MNASDHSGARPTSFEHEFAARTGLAVESASANELRVLAFLRHNLRQLPFLPADDIAVATGVSRATTVRVARRLGYPTFAALKTDAQRQFAPETASPLSRLALTTPAGGEADADAVTLDTNVRNLHQTWSRVTPSLSAVATVIERANNVYVAGSRNSYGLALYMHRILRGLRNHVHLIDPGFPDEMTDLSRNDILLLLLFSRYSKATVDILSWSGRFRAQTVVLADRGAAPFLHKVSHVLFIDTETTMLFQSMVAAIATIEALAAKVAAGSPISATKALVLKEEMASACAFYAPRPRAKSVAHAGADASTVTKP